MTEPIHLYEERFVRFSAAGLKLRLEELLLERDLSPVHFYMCHEILVWAETSLNILKSESWDLQYDGVRSMMEVAKFAKCLGESMHDTRLVGKSIELIGELEYGYLHVKRHMAEKVPFWTGRPEHVHNDGWRYA